jgi:hypothetical protein
LLSKAALIGAVLVRPAVVVTLLAVTVACEGEKSYGRQAIGAADPKTLLWVPTEATILRAANSDKRGGASVAFTIPVSDRSHLAAFAARLSKHLQEIGWRQRKRQYLNPHMATSFEEGWRPGGGGIRPPSGSPMRTTEVYKWTGEWDDAEGNVMYYGLTGYHQRRKDLMGELRIIAAYVPAKVVLENGGAR